MAKKSNSCSSAGGTGCKHIKYGTHGIGGRRGVGEGEGGGGRKRKGNSVSMSPMSGFTLAGPPESDAVGQKNLNAT